MIKRTIDISDGPNFLSIEDEQLVLSRNREEIARIPAEDIGVLLVDNVATTYTHAALTRLLSYGAVVVLCGTNHLPMGMLLSLEANELAAHRIRIEAAASLPLRKRLWKQIIAHKIRGQAMNLPVDSLIRSRLLGYAGRVRSADSANMEGVAARFYWPAMMGGNFRRDPEGLPPNNLLNYGYAVFRAALARAIVAAGLHPAFGLHHHHRNNTFALADDLLEVFRPRVDRAVRRIMVAGGGFINRQTKQTLLGLLTDEVEVAGQKGPLFVQLHRVVTSLVRCYEGTARQLELPSLSEAAGIDSADQSLQPAPTDLMDENSAPGDGNPDDPRPDTVHE